MCVAAGGGWIWLFHNQNQGDINRGGENRESKKSDMPLVNWREFHISGEVKVLNLVLWTKVVVKQKRL